VPHYRFSGINLYATALPKEMKELLQVVNGMIGGKFNAILVNMYRGGEDYISAHSDKDGVSAEHGVVTVSFGTERRFVITEKKGKGKVVEVPLISGTACHMTGAFQDLYKHEIPKESKRKDQDQSRISFTFREHVDKPRKRARK
jgi:alkylated DNA repair dioxygenase AlkB